MATSTSNSISTSMSYLDSTYQSLISNQIELERTPLTRLETQKDELDVMGAVYTDLKNFLDGLKSATRSLVSSDAFYALEEGRKVSVSDIETGTTIISASVSSSAVAGSYDIGNISLAKNDRVSSDAMEYSDQALGFSGTFYIGGYETRNATFESGSTDTVSSVSTGNIDIDQTEIASGNYYIETKQNSSGEWQFRVVDFEGNAVKIKQNGTDDTYTTNWQAIPDGGGEIDTGRGLTLNFGADSGLYVAATKDTGASVINYEAQGAAINVTSDMSLANIATEINNATYASGNKVSATIINKQLIISTDKTGEDYKLVASGNVLQSLGITTAEGAFKNSLQEAKNATFTVNDIAVERSQNKGLTDVIAGVTLNLASDAEGQSATLNVSTDNSGAQTTINSFISSFNSLQTYLKTKTSVTKEDDGTYTRGALAGDQTMVSLKNDLYSLFSKTYSIDGEYQSMAEIGIEIGESGTISITDSTKLTSALNNKFDDVVGLLDSVMSSIDAKVSRYTGTKSYVTQMIDSTENQTESVESQIDTWNKRLDTRQEYLINQYAQLQATLEAMRLQSSLVASLINASK